MVDLKVPNYASKSTSNIIRYFFAIDKLSDLNLFDKENENKIVIICQNIIWLWFDVGCSKIKLSIK